MQSQKKYWKTAFLAIFAETANVRAACAAAGNSLNLDLRDFMDLRLESQLLLCGRMKIIKHTNLIIH